MNQMTPDASMTAQADTRFGRVIAVSGTRITGLLEAKRAPRIGELVKVATVNSTVFGFVTGLSIDVPATAGTELRRVELEVVGEIDHRQGESAVFQRGVATYPSLDDPLLVANADDLRRVFTRPGARKMARASARCTRTPASPR